MDYIRSDKTGEVSVSRSWPYWPDVPVRIRMAQQIRLAITGLFGRAWPTPYERKSLDRRWRWRNFAPAEMACRHCGATYHWPGFMDALQRARDRVDAPFVILSAHRCGLHNARVGGAPQSQHLKLAVDIALQGHDPGRLYHALSEAGFTGFGFYQSFIHVDMGRTRQWFGSRQARTLWDNWLD